MLQVSLNTIFNRYTEKPKIHRRYTEDTQLKIHMSLVPILASSGSAPDLRSIDVRIAPRIGLSTLAHAVYCESRLLFGRLLSPSYSKILGTAKTAVRRPPWAVSHARRSPNHSVIQLQHGMPVLSDPIGIWLPLGNFRRSSSCIGGDHARPDSATKANRKDAHLLFSMATCPS